VFVVVQFFLSQEVAGKDTALVRLNAQISQLTDLLSLEKTGKVDMEDEIARLRASLSGIEIERDRLKATAEGAGAGESDEAADFGAGSAVAPDPAEAPEPARCPNLISSLLNATVMSLKFGSPKPS